MKKIIALAACLTMLCLLSLAASADTFNGTMVRYNNADPQLFFHDGKYYLTQTGTSRIAVFETEHIDDLKNLDIPPNIEYKGYLDGTVYDSAIYKLFGNGATINGTWSPEIHYISEDMFGTEYAGWYMFLGLRKTILKSNGDPSSEVVRNVVLKSTTDSPKGPYGYPVLDDPNLEYGTLNQSQPLLNDDGSIHDEWACGQTLLTIPEGPYKGTYTMWVSEEGRGLSGLTGEFHQKIMIAKMKSPWQIDGEVGIVTTPTQEWEFAGSSSTHARVVEGATPVYGKNGEIFITYSGSGFWDDYGIGQLTWNGENPLKTSSWVKLPVEYGNPIFTATTAKNLRGAGHASFLTDTDGNGFFCYHAYAYNYEYNKDTKQWQPSSGKWGTRAAYIEPYYIDYSAWNGVSYGVIRLGLRGDGVAADMLNSTVTFATDGEYLTSPDLYALGRTFSITLNMFEANAEGFIIYRSTDGEVFDYLATTVGSQYVDENVTEGETYYYRAYAYREEEISPVSETVSQKATTCSPFTESATANGGTVTVIVHAEDNYDSVRLYRSEDGKSFSIVQEIENVKYGETLTLTDKVTKNGTYKYVAFATNGGYEYMANWIVSAVVDVPVSAPTAQYEYIYGSHFFTLTPTSDYDKLALYISSNNLNFTEYLPNYVETGKNCYVILENLEEGTYYYYTTAIKDGVESEPSATMTMEVIFVAPPTLKISVAEGKILLTVTAAEDYDSVSILRLNERNASDLIVLSQSGPVKAGETYSALDETAICGNTYQYQATGTVRSAESDLSNSVSHTVTHYYELTEPEVPATTESAGKTAVYTCHCGDTYGGDEIPMLENPSEVTLAGDATGDGVVNMLDSLRILKAIVGMDVEVNTANADVSGDGKLTVEDALAVLKLVLN